MLVSLSIRNLAVIERIDLDLQGGLTILTGETGAGKSILLDALGLATGRRADAVGPRLDHRQCGIRRPNAPGGLHAQR